MSALLCICCESESVANSYASEAESGVLNEGTLGTTTDVVAVHETLVIRCTLTRARDLADTFGTASVRVDEDAPTVTTLVPDQAMFYALGKMDSQ